MSTKSIRRLKSGDQFNTVVTQIAKDMNETSVSEVLNRLDQYVTEDSGGDKTATPVPQQGVTGDSPAPTEPGSDTMQGLASTNLDLYKVASEQIKSGKVQPIYEKDGIPIYEITYNGEPVRFQLYAKNFLS
jgi:hypothetical protein